MKGVLFVVLFVLTSLINGSDACLSNDTYSECTYASEPPFNFYKECTSNSIEHNIDNLAWLDSDDNEIDPPRPGKKPHVYTEVDKRRGVLSLHIENLSKSSAGLYKCQEVIDGVKHIQHTYRVNVYDRIYFYDAPKTQYLIKGRESTVKCQAKGETPPRIAWLKITNDSQEILIDDLTNSDKYEIAPKGLVVKMVTDEDEGLYKCLARVEVTSEDDDWTIDVKVLTAPEINSLKALPSVTIVEGGPLALVCDADGFPEPNYVWQKVSNESLPVNGSWVQEDNKLIIEAVDETDRGTYQCSAENDAGVDKREITIAVRTHPFITSFANITAADGSRCQIICKARGWPKPSINITYDSNILPEDDGITKVLVTYSKDDEVTTVVTIDKISKNYTGYYTCNAINDLDTASEEMYLQVLYAPYFENNLEEKYAWPENPVNLTCDYQSEPPAQVFWRTETLNTELTSMDMPGEQTLHVSSDSQYGTFECLAKNDIGIAKKKFVVKKGDVPLPITYANVTDIKATSVTFEVKFIEAGPEVTGIKAEYDELENFNLTSIHQNRTWALQWDLKLNKLKPNTSYGIRFAAMNQVGSGPYSNMMLFQTLGRSIPEPVSISNDNYSVLSNGDVVLELEAPDENEEAVDSVDIKYCAIVGSEKDNDKKDCKIIKSVPTSELLITDLNPNTTYMLELVAHNSVGYSEPTSIRVDIPETVSNLSDIREQAPLNAGAVIGISVVVVIVCFILLDGLLLLTRKQGMIATCFLKKNKKKKTPGLHARDRKGLLKDKDATTDESKRPDNGHKEFEYNKVTGVITGKHSQV